MLGLGLESALDEVHVPTPIEGLSGAIQVAVGDYHYCALLEKGEVWCWGVGGVGELGTGELGVVESSPVQAQALPAAIEVAAGVEFTCALDARRQVWCWGGSYAVGQAEPRYSAVPLLVQWPDQEGVPVPLEAEDVAP